MVTYIVPGMVDYRLTLRAGKAWMTVEFTGGRSAGFGCRDATLTTDNEALQAMIEASAPYREQRIKRKEA